MPDYIDLAVTADAAELYEEGVRAIQALAPEGWVPSPAEEWLLVATARMAAQVAVLTGQVPLAIFTVYGERVLAVPALDATPAVATVHFQLNDTAGHVISAGTELVVEDNGFRTLLDLVVPPDEDAGMTAAIAIEPGAQANGLSGTVTLANPTYAFVETVTLDAPTGGGTDGEDALGYADRLADELPTLSPKAILISDFEALARRNPLVGRALALDNYNPATPGDEAEGHVTVAVHDPDGEPLPSLVRAEIAEQLAGNRVLNLFVHVIDPTYTTVDVAFVIDVMPGWEPAAVIASAGGEVAAFLAPARWGRRAQGDRTAWVPEATLHRFDLMGVLYAVEGVRHVVGLQLARAGDTLGTDDIDIDGAAALPRPGTIEGEAVV